MKTSKARQSWFRQMLTAALMLLLVLSVATPASAEYVPKELDQIVLSNFVIKTQDGKLPLPDDLHLGNRIRLTMDWSATPQYDYQLHAGDYFQFTLSPKLFVTGFPQNINFDLMDPSGEIVVAKGHIAKTGSGNPGPTVTVTFTNYVEGKADIKGSLYVVADFVQAPGNEGDQNTYDITYGDSIITSQHIKVGKVPVSNVSEEAVRKWSGIASEKVDGVTVSVPDKVRWAVRINMQKKSMKNVVLNDQMRTVEGNTPLVIFDNSFELRSYLYLLDPDTGAIVGNPVFTSIVALPKDDPRLTMNATGDGFEFRLGNTQTFAEAFPAEAAKPDNVPYADHYLTYILYFTSTCDPDERAYNDGTATYDEGVEKTFSSSYLAVGGGGGGSGAFASFTATKRWAGGPLDDRDKAELILLQEGNPFTPPSGSLKITKVNDTNYTYTWSQLPVTNPATGEKYTYSASEAGVTEGHVEIGGRLYAVLEEDKLITNTFVVPQIEVTATKQWVGGPAADHEPVAITLLRDGVAMDPQPAPVITPAAGPSDSFGYVWENLPATDDDGKAYTYSVEEAGAKAGTRVVNGNTYAVTQSGNLITNTYQVPKTEVTATKQWVGGPLGDYHAVGMNLYRQAEGMAEAELVATPPTVEPPDVTLTDGLFRYIWKNLDRTTSAGLPYSYWAEEHGVVDGEMTVDGNRYKAEGSELAFTNTYIIPKTEVTATKQWVGGPVADHEPVVITLLRDGVALDPQPAPVITPATGPADSFGYAWEDLPATDDDGKAYTYSVEEAGAKAGTRVVNGNTYAVSQAADNTITNTYQKPEPAKLAITLKKELTGAELAADAFTFHLYGTDLTTPLQSGTNALDGSLSFALQFDAEGDYVLHVKEKDAGAEGMAYDASQYKLTYRVQMGEGNKLVAELIALEKNGESIEKVLPLIFRNSFTPSTPEPTAEPTPEPTAEPTPEPTAEPTAEPTPTPTFTPAPIVTQEPQPPDPTFPAIKVPLSARKILQNGSLKAGTYVFQLKDSAGKVLATVSNDADGRIAFPDRSFSRVVTNYRYTIHEVAGEDSRIVYDQTVYTVKVSTKAVGGELQATVDIERNGTPYAGEMTFTNTQKAPPTGDQQYQLMLMLVVSSLALASIAILMRVRRQRSE